MDENELKDKNTANMKVVFGGCSDGCCGGCAIPDNTYVLTPKELQEYTEQYHKQELEKSMPSEGEIQKAKLSMPRVTGEYSITIDIEREDAFIYAVKWFRQSLQSKK